MSSHVSIVIPVYNEADSIEAVLRKVAATDLDKEILVVNDGSTDATAAILARLEDALPIRVIRHPRNLGKGRAIRSGLARSQGDIILIQDADFEYDPSDYPALLNPLLEEHAQVVYGSRFLGPQRVRLSWHRLGNWIVTAMVNALFHASLTDVGTGYKAFRRTVAERLSLRASGFEFEVEFTCKALRLGYPIVEVPISYRGRSYAEGKKMTWTDGLWAVWVILYCRLNPQY